MSALDVLAAALYETATGNPGAWSAEPEVTHDAYREQAEVVMERMAEAMPAATGSLDDAIDLAATVAEGANEIAGEKGYPDWEESIRLLHRLRDATWHLGVVDAGLVRHIYLTGEHGDTDLDGIGRVKIQRGRDRKDWDGRAVIQAVIDAHMERLEGELPNDPWDIAEWLLEVLPTDRPRVTPLRALGIDPKAFCTETPGKPGVQLPPRN